MKAKIWLLFTGLALSGLVLNGCYTQLARPDQEEDTQVVRESEPVEEESQEAYTKEESDDRHATDVYVFGGGWYRPYGYYPGWSWYRYPRSRFYVSVGFGYYDPFDPWGWCGTPWSWCDPWDYYYSGYRNPYYGWRPSYYYDPFYAPHYVYRDRVVEQKKRTITRRGSKPVDDNSAGTYAGGSSHGSLARPVAGTYARGDDGSYRRVRRTDAAATDRRNEPASVTGSNNGSGNDSGRRTIKRSSSGNNDTGYRRPASRGGSSGDSRGSVRRSKPSSDSGDSGSRRGSNGSSGSGGSVSKPSGSSGQSSPPSSNKGSSNGGSSNRRTRN